MSWTNMTSPNKKRSFSQIAAFVLATSIVAALGSGPSARAASLAATLPAYASVRLDLQYGRADKAISLLSKRLTANPTDDAAHQLLCRVYLQEERWRDAAQECETAVRLAPGDSNNHLWLGRAYGEVAAHASLASAYGLARKVHVEFETAVRLDPKNVAALSDLGEYYVDVPRLIGGGTGHAEKIARQLASLDATRFHALQAKIEGKKGDLTSAEHEWKLAIQTSHDPAEQWMDLATFYAGQKDLAAMQQAIANGIAANRPDASPLVTAASLLVAHHRDLGHAEELLRQYLASPNQSEDAPAFQVRVQLGRLLASLGRPTAARAQFAAAQALASDYTLAQHG